jgi:hypothetical protein
VEDMCYERRRAEACVVWCDTHTTSFFVGLQFSKKTMNTRPKKSAVVKWTWRLRASWRLREKKRASAGERRKFEKYMAQRSNEFCPVVNYNDSKTDTSVRPNEIARYYSNAHFFPFLFGSCFFLHEIQLFRYASCRGSTIPCLPRLDTQSLTGGLIAAPAPAAATPEWGGPFP